MLTSIAGFDGVVAAILSPTRVFEFLVRSSGALIVYIFIAVALAAYVVLRKNR